MLLFLVCPLTQFAAEGGSLEKGAHIPTLSGSNNQNQYIERNVIITIVCSSNSSFDPILITQLPLS